MAFNNSASVNPDNTGDLLIFGYGSMSMNGTSTLNSYVYVQNTLSMYNSSRINGRVTANKVYMTDSSKINDSVHTSDLTCFPDTFSAGTLDSNWVVASSGGGFLPSIVSDRMRLTENKTYQATSVTYQRLFPAAGNLVTIEFDQAAYGGSKADGIAMVLSDASITPQPGSSGGPLGYGYKSGAPGFAGGWLGIGIDEFGNFRAEGGANSQAKVANTVSIRGSGSAYSGYRYLFGTNTLNPTIHSGSTYPSPPHRYRLTVDSRTNGQALVAIQRDTGSGYVTLIPTFNAIGQQDQAKVPANFYLSFTGSTGGSTNIHELDNVRICALKSNPVGKQIDHFEFDHSGQALTCNPEEMTIRACADASCSTLVTDTVTAVLSLSDGIWTTGSSVTFTGGTSKVSLRKNTAGSTTIGVRSSTPATKPMSKTLCRAGSGALSEASCTLSFADSGFIFDVPDIIANKAATNVVVKAVKKDDSTKQCVPGFASTSKTLNFWSDYIDPVAAGRPESRHVSVNGSAIGRTSAEATPLTLAFDAQGQTTLSSVNYTDAGKMQLNARYTGLTGSEEEGLLMNGSDQFVSRPVGLCILPETVCAAGNSSCPYFRRAGESFSVGLIAQAWESDSDADICAGNLTTPNFALSGIALGSTLVAPTGGVSATVGTASYNHVASSSAQQTVSQSLSEVGVFRLTATPPSYLGTTIPVTSSAPVGRFTPYDFAISNASMTPGCGTFSYMGQPMPTGFVVAARNMSQATTANYRNEFATATLALVAENSDNGVPLSSRLSGLGGLGWQAGLFTTPENYAVTFTQNPSPDGPFSQLAIGLSVADNEKDVVIPLVGTNMNAATAGSCGSNCDAVTLGVQDLRHGRLKPVTGRTSASNPLALPLTIESYTATGWQRSADDTCTQLDLTASGGFLFDRGYVPSKAELTLIDNSSKSRLALTQEPAAPASQPTSSTAKEGYIWLHFTAPGISDRVHYRLDLAKQPAAPVWLNYDWDNNGIANVDDMGGWAFFNLWRSSDRVIYRRELLQ
ncbi:MAG: MSHA biogenesis protein MshQ [Aeromonadaceae bacterium]